MPSLPLSSFASDCGRAAEARLVAERAGGRTILRRQHVGYPMHVTRGFYLDTVRPDLLTLYIQSASGGLYAGDRLALEIAVEEGAALHVTTQAATVVHDARDQVSAQHVHLSVGAGAFCAVTSDPYVLFPGAKLCLETAAVVAEDAALIFADGFAVHDPGRTGRSFTEYAGRLRVLRPDGRILLCDRGRIDGVEACRGPLGAMTAAANLIIVAPPERRPPIPDLMRAAEQVCCLLGASEAPNQAGVVMRLLAPDGGILARGIEAAFHVAARAALGAELARRRK
ncbi:MAG TPA: urease accessory protein UreD [Bradyrhizobium sp.]|nr:urease accessory protein UreD [Bradyrhizobium sp.]